MSVTYDPVLVLASLLVGIMASFTGLRLLMGLRSRDEFTKKVQLAKASVALGGGIWSMHFVAMLALSLPVVIYYDALYTLGSALIAILITGVGLALMHFGARTFYKTAAAGTLIGLGIASMHYIGMEAITGDCSVTYVPVGFVVSVGIAILFSFCALQLAYRNRTFLQLVLGSVLLGITISGMHYSAMAFTGFVRIEGAGPPLDVTLPDAYLALFVALAAFLVCAMFLLTALPLHYRDGERDVLEIDREPAGRAANDDSFTAPGDKVVPPRNQPKPVRLPYEHNHCTSFIDADAVRAVKAEGHYTRILDGEKSHFCPWSISKVEEHLAGRHFVRTHRSFLLNLAHVEGFKRHKDTALVIVKGAPEIEVPVSRSHVGSVRKALGI